MKVLFAAVAGVVAAMSMVSTACGADLQAPPFWTSDQIRAARPLAEADTVVFDLTRTVTGGKDAGVKTQTVILAPTFTEVIEGGTHRLYDHALCRVLSWASPDKGVESTSCYAGPAFRVFEIANREMLAQITAKAGIKADDTPLDLYVSEAELGVQRKATEPFTRRQTPAAVEYVLGQTVQTRLLPGSGLNAGEARDLMRYLALEIPLHPQIRHQMVKDGKLFARLEIEEGFGRHEVLTVSNVRRERRAYPLPAGLPSALVLAVLKPQTIHDRGVHEAILAAEAQSKIAKPSFDELVGAIGKAGTEKRPMAVMFLFFELSQQYGDVASEPRGQAALQSVVPAIRAALSDPAVAKVFQANTLAGDPRAPGDRQAAAKNLAGVDLAGAPFGTFRNVTFANLVSGSGDVSKWDPSAFAGMPKTLTDNYWLHIAAYPWGANAYADAGNVYIRGYQVNDAWLSFDLGRAVDPQWKKGATANIGQMEDALRQAQPDFF